MLVTKAGRWKGHWRTFGVPEGLPSPDIFAVLQDRAGDLWFGTWGGVSRYDGEQFVPLTTQDGLAYNVVRSTGDGGLSPKGCSHPCFLS